MPSNKNDLLSKCTTELTECCTITSLTKYHFERSDTAPRLIYIKGDYSEDTREYPIGRNEKSESENAWCRKPGVIYRKCGHGTARKRIIQQFGNESGGKSTNPLHFHRIQKWILVSPKQTGHENNNEVVEIPTTELRINDCLTLSEDCTRYSIFIWNWIAATNESKGTMSGMGARDKARRILLKLY
jgi:hypothetical protein